MGVTSGLRRIPISIRLKDEKELVRLSSSLCLGSDAQLAQAQERTLSTAGSETPQNKTNCGELMMQSAN